MCIHAVDCYILTRKRGIARVKILVLNIEREFRIWSLVNRQKDSISGV
jgi:hypothetical protein